MRMFNDEHERSSKNNFSYSFSVGAWSQMCVCIVEMYKKYSYDHPINNTTNSCLDGTQHIWTTFLKCATKEEIILMASTLHSSYECSSGMRNTF